jgi:hypothetical protein
MTDTYRALCAELTEELVNEYGYCTEWEKGLPLCESNVSELLTRARAALSQPEPAAPTDEEILKLAAKELCYEFDESWFLTGRNCPDLDTDPCELLNFARAVLTRWGTPANQPVAVSERLPGAEDCDAEGRCWWFVPEDDERPSGWYLDGQPPAREIRFYGNTHWLPHHALPMPTPTNNTREEN